jgi:RHS repeat-associated protein
MWNEDEIWREGSLLAYVSPNGVRHYGLDHLGSPVVVTDSTGRLIGNIAYDAFGGGGATGAGMLEYTGHERDSATVGPQAGTARLPDYLHARYYDPSRGRFLSVDTHLGTPAFPQSWNRYAYARSNPLKYVDPNGKDIQLAGVNSTAVFDFLVRTAQHPLGRADLTALARNHNFLVTYHDEPINSPQQIANIKAQGGNVTLAITTPDRTVGATKADIGIDTNAVPVLHPDPSGVTTTAHEDNHAINVMNGMPWPQVVATDTSGSAEAYGAQVVASPTDMTQRQAEVYVTQLFLPEEAPQTLTDTEQDLPPEI